MSTILRSVRLESCLLSRAQLAPPFSVESAGLPSMVFHAVVEGRCWIRLAKDSGARPLATGDVAIVGPARGHVIAAPADRSPVPITSLSAVSTGSGVSLIEYGPRTDATRIICGTLEVDHPAAAGLLELLPGLSILSADDDAWGRWLRATIALLDGEIETDGVGAAVVATRLADLIVTLVLRTLADSGRELPGWVAAARDPKVGEALALIHSEPAQNWTAPKLAARVGLSRTRFYERFRELVGETPARYLARWRVHAAGDLMRDDGLSLREVAERVGYSSEDALSRAFRRITGQSAGAYRRAHSRSRH